MPEDEGIQRLFVGHTSRCWGCANTSIKCFCIVVKCLSYVSPASLVMLISPKLRLLMRKHPLTRTLLALLTWVLFLAVSLFVSCYPR